MIAEATDWTIMLLFIFLGIAGVVALLGVASLALVFMYSMFRRVNR